MIHLPNDFKEFLRLLNDRSVEYLLIGGYAVGYYGYPRATGDMDVWVAAGRENVERIVSSLREFGFTDPQLTLELFANPNQVIRMGVPPLRIEVVTDISGVQFAPCYRRRASGNIDGMDVSIISLPDLLANKRAAGRLKDRDDLENLIPPGR
ncbi:MAG: nucleotidyltransferase [Planctomycetota bacterium]|nr:nucleotidyltransferase [Planctomycetota bacterium]